MRLFRRLASDIAYAKGFLRTLKRVAPITQDRNRTLRDLAEDLAARYNERIALVSSRESLTYNEWNGRANRYARWAKKCGIGKGEVVALLMPNRPEYLCVWLGIAKIGGITALLNTNLVAESLAHCINAVKARAIIVDASLISTFESAKPFLDQPLAIFAHGETDRYQGIDAALAGFTDTNLSPGERVPLTIDDGCLYIYTSGTTGMPKAANINHYRVQLAMLGFAGATGARKTDRIYDCLPMYHTSGGICAPGAALAAGGTCVIKERFSAREFWADIVHNKCTMAAYIGELCRYLVNTPPGPYDTSHRLRLCFGNGLRPDVWPRFSERFGIERILEFYAATEGNVALFNFDSMPGSIGRIPKWAESKFVVAIIRIDPATGNPVRGADGLCMECAPGEVGEALGEVIDDPKRPGNRFEGYADKAASERKVLRHVRRKGDAWFRTGDLMRKDKLGYFYFVDRIGDTFRWKGENVATSEVEAAIAGFPGVLEATVYGVEVPGLEGRAGMAALVLDDPKRFDFQAFHAHLARRLPDYARPLFLRIQPRLAATGTFKLRKTDLVAEGFDPRVSEEPLYFGAPGETGFVPLDPVVYSEILSGKYRL